MAINPKYLVTTHLTNIKPIEPTGNFEPLLSALPAISPGKVGTVVKIICFPAGTISRLPEALCTLNTSETGQDSRC